MGRNPSRYCSSEARSPAQRRTTAGLAQAPSREIQDAAPGQVCRRPPAKDGHRKNAETRTARSFLERQSHPRPRLTSPPCHPERSETFRFEKRFAESKDRYWSTAQFVRKTRYG